MNVAQQIATLKSEKASLMLEHKAEKVEARKTAEKLACLFYPKTQKVKYFVTDLNVVELCMMLHDTYGPDAPAVTSFFTIPKDEEVQIPDSFYDL